MGTNKRGSYTIKRKPAVKPNYRPDGSIRSYSVRISVNSKEIKKSFATKEQADEFAEAIASERLERIVANQFASKIPVEKVLDEWFKEASVSPSSLRVYMGAARHIPDSINSKYVNELTENDIRTIVIDVRRDAPSVANFIMVIFKECLAWAAKKYKFEAPEVDWKDFHKKYWQESEGEINFLTPIEVGKVVSFAHEAADRGLVHPYTPYALKLVLMTGIRIGELVGLQVKNIDLTRGKLYVKNTVATKPKGGLYLKDGTKSGERVYRTIPLNESAKEALVKLLEFRDIYQKKYNIETPFLIVRTRYISTQMNSFVHPITWWREVESLGELLEKEDISLLHCKKFIPHVLRHTFATTYLMQTRGNFRSALVALQGFMGHASIETTMRYLHVVEAESDNSVTAMDSLF